jgi:hypothetical protein
MAKIAYVPRSFKPDSMAAIVTAESIAADYARQGYDLTLRQLYYAHVARGLIPNTDASYKNLGNLINNARLAGLIDWDYLVDRTRNLLSLGTWSSPDSIVAACASQYREDKWRNQPEYVEVWVEKEALAGVVARPANRWQAPYFSCRGYVSQSEMHEAAMRLRRRERNGQKVTVIHLGDHDPSGLDMTRDIRDRLSMFGSRATVERIALNMDQIEQYQPPPNPAKITDSRAAEYIERFHDPDVDEPGMARSWELDALEPTVLDALIDETIQAHLDPTAWAAMLDEEETHRQELVVVSDRWSDVVSYAQDEDER